MKITRGIGDAQVEAVLLYGQDVRTSLLQLPGNSVHAVCTSPPYWGLRNYGVPPLIWGGVPTCEHEWGSQLPQERRGVSGAGSGGDGQYCQRCSAWQGDLGLEPTPDLFVEHLVEVFREVQRVLRPDGLLYVNLGDSYAGSGRAGKNPEYQARHTSFGGVNKLAADGGYGAPQPVPPGLKPKDLVGVPWRVAFALQAEGWYLRAAIPWIKYSCMPESVTDRPTNAVEYIFQFAHPDSGGSYYYDMESVRVANLSNYSKDALSKKQGGDVRPEGNNFNKQQRMEEGEGTPKTRAERAALLNEDGRNRRNSDWWRESLDLAIADMQQAKGLVHGVDGEPLGFMVNPKPYHGAHFAVWPHDLVEPMIKAATSGHGVCSSCGAPWTRKSLRLIPGPASGAAIGGDPARRDGGTRVRSSKGGGNELARVTHFGDWEATCTCSASLVPATVLDPFSGSATTGMVALDLGRNYIGLDLNKDYLTLAEARIQHRVAPAKVQEESVGLFDL